MLDGLESRDLASKTPTCFYWLACGVPLAYFDKEDMMAAFLTSHLTPHSSHFTLILMASSCDGLQQSSTSTIILFTTTYYHEDEGHRAQSDLLAQQQGFCCI